MIGYKKAQEGHKALLAHDRFFGLPHPSQTKISCLTGFKAFLGAFGGWISTEKMKLLYGKLKPWILRKMAAKMRRPKFSFWLNFPHKEN